MDYSMESLMGYFVYAVSAGCAITVFFGFVSWGIAKVVQLFKDITGKGG